MVVFKGIFGSHLYGLNTADSDLDFKQIILPPTRELIFEKNKIIEKHSEEEDVTVMNLVSFINNLRKADTVSMDMIHTPGKFTIQSGPVWKKIQEYRSDAYSKNMRGVLGYIKTQTSKYGHKEERLSELTEFLDYIVNNQFENNRKVGELVTYLADRKYKHIKYTMARRIGAQPSIEIIGKQIQCTWEMHELINFLRANISSYGARTSNAVSSRGDWKSLSHSLRALLQLKELVETRNIIFPLSYASTIMPVKLGKVDAEYVRSMLTDLYDEVTELLEKSDLPDEPNMSRFESVVLENLY